MPQLQNLILTDRAATPVNHTFTPRDVVNGLGTVVEVTGVPIGENRVQVALNRNAQTGKYKGVVKIACPIVQNALINGVSTPTVVRTAYADMTFTFEPTSSEQERNDLVGFASQALLANKPLVHDALVKLQGIY